VRGFNERRPDWLVRPLGLDKTQAMAERMEAQAVRFCQAASARASDPEVRKLPGDLAVMEAGAESLARRLRETHAPADVRAEESEVERRNFVLTELQPGLAEPMEGFVSPLAPTFAAALAQVLAAAILIGTA
jgi:erythrin-vacuolar iron transport family protein